MCRRCIDRTSNGDRGVEYLKLYINVRVNSVFTAIINNIFIFYFEHIIVNPQ